MSVPRVKAGDILGMERYSLGTIRRGIGYLIEARCDLFLFHHRRHDKVTDDVRCIFVVKSIIYKSPNSRSLKDDSVNATGRICS